MLYSRSQPILRIPRYFLFWSRHAYTKIDKMLLKKASEFVDADLGLKQRALRARLNQGSGFDNTETSAEPRLKQASSGTE